VTKEPVWVPKVAALAIHDVLLAEHGGKPGIRDEGLLDAAMDAPRNHFAYEQASLFRLAAVDAHGLSQNHPFADGNKRVAFTVAATFLELNGMQLTAPEEEAFAMMSSLAAGDLSRDEFESWLSRSCRPL
jgi:death-on-curing protein